MKDTITNDVKNTVAVEIFCDGACSGNPGKGGWAALIRRGKNEMVISGSAADTTNNQMELTAVISALEMLNPSETVTVFSDSKYVVDGITNWLPGWKKNNWITATKTRVKNKELWEKLDLLASKYHAKFNWVKGHSTDEIDLVDQYAKEKTR